MQPEAMESMWKVVERDSLLTPAQLKRLGDHKYSASDGSLLDGLCMKQSRPHLLPNVPMSLQYLVGLRFWDWLVEKYPLWLAPNLITLIGFLCNLIAVVILSALAPTGKEDVRLA